MIDKICEEKVKFPVIVNNTSVLANEYKTVLTCSTDDASLLATGDDLMNVGRRCKGLIQVESVCITRIDEQHYKADLTC